MNTPKEARVLALERLQARIGTLLGDLQPQVTAAAEDVWGLWGDLSNTSTETTATYSGTLTGCAGAGVSGVVITLSTGGTVTSTSGGAFSGSVTFSGSTVSVTFTTAATSQYQASSHTKSLVSGANALGSLAMTPIVTSRPTINTPSNILTCGSSGGTVSLTGITDGNSGGALPITVSATSSNTAAIPTPTISYTSPNTTGTLTYTVSGATTTNIFLKVTNGGSGFCGGVTSYVTSFSIQNKVPTTPTLNSISNTGPFLTGSGNQTQSLTGIGPGAGNTAFPWNLAVSASSSNPGIVGIVSTSYTNSNSTGSVTYSIGSVGTATITITVTDNNLSRCSPSDNVFSQTFTVTVIT